MVKLKVKMRKVILKSFETFVAQPLSVLCDKIVRIASLKNPLADFKSVSAQVFDDTVQINVVNSPAAYNLLSAVAYKKRMHQLRNPQTNENKDSAVFNQLTLT
jgi:hypothetical protein